MLFLVALEVGVNSLNSHLWKIDKMVDIQECNSGN